ncbi:uncharacterized protein VICG_01404 [Vittaforma corneae ATCC 50505]|uniref:Uncharacterized protein n=1 Tax=Vittaforma corneae (strain ATCC 50505) TaxID=993615 RepID=L2GM16_VITCO|nr:uncharacterized protein VICG_01404 [Vittaforma corneae ATCC 50505]ELA41540.1 hypothetical protein VICG_01404 [Vittaforma corneae ATCC 50505]
MKEQIEKDRESLRNQNTQDLGFSYIPLLQAQKTAKTKVKLSKLSTLNILIYLEEGFQKSDKHMLSNIERIKREVSQRTDLFEAVLKYLENKKVRDDLFYWTPGYKISNIFCFIMDIIPNFIPLYKEYYIEKIVCKREFYDASNFVKERFSNDYEQFNLINMDLSMFRNCISTHIWTHENVGLDQSEIQALEKLNIPYFVNFTDDLEAYIVVTTSFVDVTIGNHSFTVRLDALIGLLVRNEKYRNFWDEHGISYETFNQKADVIL